MSSTNPYALNQDFVPAAEAAVEERAAFLKRTYGWLMIGIFAWCITLYAAEHNETVQRLALTLGTNWIVTILLLMGGAFAVRLTSTKALIGPVVYLLYAFMFGLIVAPAVLIANSADGGIAVQHASLATGGVFLVLTAYVFISGKDFSFMGGALALISGAIFVGLLISFFTGFSWGPWMSIGIALLYCGYILYDTSQVLHHLPTNMHIAAAANLFADVVLLFYHLLLLFMSRDD